MNESPPTGVIPAGAVQRTAQPVLIDCGAGDGSESNGLISIVPLMEGILVAGIEVRCNCGSSVVLECVYDDGATSLVTDPAAVTPAEPAAGPPAEPAADPVPNPAADDAEEQT